MEFRILGPLEVRHDGEGRIPLGAGKQRAALAILLLHPNQVLTTERLIDELWGDSPPKAARKALHVYVAGLRKALGAQRIRTHGPGYRLEVAPGELDLDRFERLVQTGRDLRAGGDYAGAATALREALALWAGEPLADLSSEPFARTAAPRLDELRLEALEERIDAELELGHGSELVGELEALVAEHPYRERLRGQLMLALYRSGRQADALAAYQETRKLLVEELGVEPSPALQRLEGAILRQEPALETALQEPAAAAPPPRTIKSARRLDRRLLAAIPLALLAAGLAALGLDRWTGSDSLSRVDANAIGVIDADAAAIEAQVPLPGGRPAAIATGGGFVWTVSEAEGTVSRIDLEGRDVQTLDIGESVNGVAYGGGSVWATNSEEQAVFQINPDRLGVVQQFAVGNGPSAVAFGEGAVWVANTIDGTLSRIDLAGGPPKTIPVGAAPTGIAVGQGAVWVTNEATGTVLRLDPRSGTIVQPISVGNGPTGIAGGEGAVWVANRLDGTVSRIDPAMNSVSATIPDVGAGPTAVAAGHGAVWVANSGDSTIARIDPDTGRVNERIPVESSPNAIVLAGGNAWATTLPSLAAHRGGVLRVESRPLECDCVDPASPDLYPVGSTVIPLAYDGLLAYRRVAGIGGAAVVPNLAVRVPAPTAQGRTYTFQLRRGVLYSDGTPVRASDFRYSLERLLTLDPDFPVYDAIAGAADCTSRPPGRCDLAEGIEVDDATGRITIRLSRPDPDLLYKLTYPHASIVPAGTPLRVARTKPIPSTGPYRIAHLDPNRELRVVRNPHFKVWSHDARPDGYPDQIRYRLTGDEDGHVAAVERGRADVMLSPPVERQKELLTKYPGRLHSDVVPWTDYMFMNARVPPFDDLRVRQALNYAVDRKRIVDLRGGPLAALPTCQVLPPPVSGYRPYCPYTLGRNPAGTWTAPDLAKAKALVAASGTEGMQVEVLAYDQFGRVGYGRYFASLLRRLGYRSSLRIIPALFPDYLEYAGNSRNRAQLGTMGWYSDFPSSALRYLFSCASFLPESAANRNFSAFCDRGVDAKMARASDLQASDPVRANALWAQADRMLVDRAAAVPLVNQHIVGFVSERVGNYQLHPQRLTLLDQLWVR
jgi:YVTN family beta-propeller protein